MPHTLRITLDDEFAARIQRAVDDVGKRMIADGDRPPTFVEVVSEIIKQGLIVSEGSRGDLMGDGRRVADLSLRELLQATGTFDAAAARRAAIEARENGERLAEKLRTVVMDANVLAVLAPTRVRTREGAENLTKEMMSQLQPGHALAVLFAVVEDHEPIPTTAKAPGVN